MLPLYQVPWSTPPAPETPSSEPVSDAVGARAPTPTTNAAIGLVTGTSPEPTTMMDAREGAPPVSAPGSPALSDVASPDLPAPASSNLSVEPTLSAPPLALTPAPIATSLKAKVTDPPTSAPRPMNLQEASAGKLTAVAEISDLTPVARAVAETAARPWVADAFKAAAPTPVPGEPLQLTKPETTSADVRPDAVEGGAGSASVPQTASLFARALARVGAPGAAQAPLVFSRTEHAPLQGPAVLPQGGATESQAGAGALPEAIASPPSETIDSGPLEQQVVQAIKLQWQAGVGEATIKLQPEHLGAMTVSLRVDSGSVSAEMRVETATAQHWITNHQVDLRAALERQGLTLGRMIVTQDSDPKRQFDRQQRRPAPSTRARRGAAPAEFTLAS
jgi:flagellar hook-length control protein FliK